MTPRLPTPGGDDGQWGNLLNEYLSVAHNDDGTLKAAADIEQALTDSSAALTTANGVQTALGAKAPLADPTFTGHVTVPTPTNATDAVTKAYVDANAGGTLDATTSIKGKIKLAGDLDGTADLPTVPGLADKVSKSGDTMTGTLGVSTANSYGTLTVGGNVATDAQGDIFSQRDGSANATYPVFARYWNNHDTFPAGTFIFGSGINPWVGIEQPGGANVNLFRVHANTTSLSNDVTVGGAISGVSKLQVPVLRVTLTTYGSVGTITRDVPLYLQSDGTTWAASEALTTVPFTIGAAGHVAHLGFEPVNMPFGSFFFNVLTCSLTVTNAAADQVIEANIPGSFEVADGFESLYDPVVWNPTPVTQVGSDLSVDSNLYIDTDTAGVFQAMAQFTAGILFDDGTGHQGN